jgi:ATP-binding cassette subfamily B protein/subfamily B ATP-binding cassette protein MsbA
MASRIGSRRRFTEYLREHSRKRAAGEFTPSKMALGENTRQAARHRSFFALLRQFLELIEGHRLSLAFALATLSVSTMLALLPPAATKVAIDYVLSGKPLPDSWSRLHLPTDRKTLLLYTAIAVVVVTIVENMVHLWGR